MTIEQKAKAYDEALERAKDYYKINQKIGESEENDMLSDIFPELSESEDELTWLTKYIEEEAYSLSMDIRDNEDRIKYEKLQKALAWLEKQGEQKPSTEVEPKFKVGDWVFIEEVKGYKNGPFQIKAVDSFGYSFDEYHTIPFMYEDLLSKWTIKDAKDGDVLVTVGDKRPFIHKGCLDPNHPDSPVAYCGIDSEGYFCKGGDKFDHWWTDDKVHPATKEQCKLLFQKMEEAGYEWDEEKKELKLLITNGGDFESENCEQKSTWSEEDEKMLDDAIGAVYAADYYTYDDKEEIEHWLKSLKNRYTWKPTDEQMQCLLSEVTAWTKGCPKQIVLESLYNDLKKLTE